MKTKLFILYFIVLVACSGEKQNVPEDVLPKEKMIPLIIDIYLAESKVSNLGLSRDSSLAIFEVYEDTLFELHAVDEAVYRRSVTYYYDHPAMMESIYESVLDSMNLREQRLKEMKRDKNERDAKEKEEGS